MHNKSTLTYFKTSLAASYGCACICKWDVNETGHIFSRKFEFDYFRKTTQPILICFEEILFRLKW